MDHWAESNWLDVVIAEVPRPFAGLVAEFGVAPLPVKAQKDLSVYCTGVVAALVDRDLLRLKSDLLGQLQRVDSVAEPERSRGLQTELQRVEQERRTLREE